MAVLKMALVRRVFSAVLACDAGFALMVVFSGFVIRVPEMKKPEGPGPFGLCLLECLRQKTTLNFPLY